MTQDLLLTAESWQLCGLLCLEATKLLIRPKLWLCSNKDRQTWAMHTQHRHYMTLLLSHHPSSSHWTTHWHLEPELFSLFLWILESHLIKTTDTSQSPYQSMKLWAYVFSCYLLNSPSSSGNSCGLSSTSSKAWPKHHCCASCLVTPRTQKRDPDTTQTTICHKFLLKARQPTHHLHRPFRTPKWALLVKVLPLWVSKNSAFPDHPSVNSNKFFKDLSHTTHITLYIQFYGTYRFTVNIYDESLRRLCNLRWHMEDTRDNTQADICCVVFVVDAPWIPGDGVLFLHRFR